MMTLVIGGAASGKSEFAERLVLDAGNRPRYYIATMQPFDDECRERIRRTGKCGQKSSSKQWSAL